MRFRIIFLQFGEAAIYYNAAISRWQTGALLVFLFGEMNPAPTQKKQCLPDEQMI